VEVFKRGLAFLAVWLDVVDVIAADEYETREWRKIGIRKLMRATKLTQKAIYSILSGKRVRQQTMNVFRTGLASLEI
jgi:hypothetical protein